MSIERKTTANNWGFMWSARPSRQQSGEAPVERNPYPALCMEIGLGFGCDQSWLMKKNVVKRIQKQISKFELKPEDLEFSN